MLRRSNGLQLIRVAEDQVVLKLGIHELLLSGPSTKAIVEPLLEMLDGSKSTEQIVAAFPDHLRGDVEGLLTALRARRMIAEGPNADSDTNADVFQSSFYANFGPVGANVVEKLRAKVVVIHGVNLISRVLVPNLLEMEIGRITLIDNPILSNHLISHRWVEEARRDAPVLDGKERLRLVDKGLAEQELEEAALLCATSDFGEAETLLDINRIALSANKPYLPVWLAEMVGYVGPLVYPFETACLRCYRLRADSNDPRHAISQSIRAHMTTDPEARSGIGMLPPMVGILGQIAAMEVTKWLSGFAPSDVVSRLIEVNLISFRSSVRRVLKVPRCPDCSRVTHHGLRVLNYGPQVPYRA